MVAVRSRTLDRMGQPALIWFRSRTVNDSGSSWPTSSVVPHRGHAFEMTIEGLGSISPTAIELLVMGEAIVVNGELRVRQARTIAGAAGCARVQSASPRQIRRCLGSFPGGDRYFAR